MDQAGYDKPPLVDLPHESAQYIVEGRVLPSPDHLDYSDDTIYTNGRKGYGIVADGMGGYMGGEQASKAVVENATPYIDLLAENSGINETVVAVKTGLVEAKKALDRVHEQPKLQTADTTFNFARICFSPDKQRKFVVSANIGDSRTYVWSTAEGKLIQLTRDHSYVQPLVDTGVINDQEAFLNPVRNIVTKSVDGLQGVDAKSLQGVDFYVRELKKDDVVIVTSDGIHDNLSPSGLETAVKYGIDHTKDQGYRGLAENLCERARVISLAEKPYSKPDDFSAIVITAKPGNPTPGVG